MENNQQKGILKRIKAMVLVGLLMAGVALVCNVNTDYVYAAEPQKVDDYLVKEYSNITKYRQKDALEIPAVYDDNATESSKWLFAGWYTDEKCTISLSSGAVCTGTKEMNGTYYAKFVSADVLSVKCQITKNTKSTSGSTKLRCVSSVDSLKYKKIGFDLITPSGTKYMESSKVGTRINATDSSIAYSFSPKVVDTESEYFFSAIETIEQENFAKGYIVQPYWITKDGTKVYGVNKYVTVMEGVTDKTPTTIHVPAKMDAKPTGTLSVEGGNATAVSCIEYKDGYAHFAVTVADRNALNSATKFVIKEGGAEIATYIYRNLSTKYDGTDAKKDVSWYEVYKDIDDEFVIATSADLYGFAGTISSSNKFANKTVYLVNDIEANKGTANKETLTWDKAKDEDGNEIEPYHWTRIGDDANRFAGVFDGQMHTISGIYLIPNNGVNFQGLFGAMVYPAEIKNFRLTNSFIDANSSQSNAVGSIVGRVRGGTLDSIYSDAIILANQYNIGGLVGAIPSNIQDSTTMNNCWYDGVLVNNYNGTSLGPYTGGLFGNTSSSATMKNCLNTGAITAKQYNKTTTAYVGGLVGYVANNGVLIKIEHCFNAGQVAYNSNAINGYGMIVGHIASGSVDIKNNTFYLLNEDCSVAMNGAEDTTKISVDKTEVTGINALKKLPSLFSYITDEATGARESYWAITPNGVPVLASFAEYADAMPVDTSWYNTSDTEYTLSDAGDLYGLSLLSQEDPFTGKEFTLSKDIKINAGTPYGADGVEDAADDQTPDDWSKVAPDYRWIGIGCETHPFAGKFNGNMKTISGVYLSASESQVGLFNYTDSSATIKNLKLTDSYFFTTKGGIGSIVGKGDGTFDTIYSNAIVDGTTCWIGGLVGLTATTPGVTMNNCWFDGEVTQNGVGHSTELANTGGLVGIVNGNSSFTNCLNTGDVTAEHTKTTTPGVAGLVGRVSNPGTITVKNSLNTGKVSAAPGATNNYGPIVGVGNAARIVATDTYAVTDETGEKSIWPVGVTKVASTSISGTGALKNMKNLFTTPTDEDSYDSCWAVVLNDTPVLEAFAEVPGKECLTIDTSWYNGKGNYTLKDVSDLYGFTMLSARIDFAEETVSLSKDIDSIVVNEGKPYGEDGKAGGGDDWEPKYEWISIGSTAKPFAGTFDGNMKSIEGAYWNKVTFAGLFSAIKEGSVIRNLSLKNSYMNSVGVNSGSIVGRALGGTIDTVYSDTIVIGTDTNIGGLVGQVSGSAAETITLNNCWFAGSVTNNTATQQNTGGLIGTVLKDANVTNCLNTGAVSMPKYSKNEGTEEEPVVKPCVGGFVGYVASDVTEGEETRDTNVLFSRCFNAGVITYNNVTGITGFGTFVGYTPKTSVCFQNSYSTVENELKAYARGSSDSILSNFGRFYKSEAYGTKALEKASALFDAQEGENYRYYWAIVEDGTPVLASFAEYAGKDAIAIDTSWYDANKDSYTLNDAGDLYGFALLSAQEAIAGYAGKTITLGQDITVNKGTAADWATAAPQFEWVSICTNADYRFQGTFEGNGKTISGVYLDETTTYRGFFGYTDNGSVVRNFRLMNSFFNSTAQAIGSVAGNARGSFDAIYSNAIVIGANANVGGMLGQISGNGVEITNCWFDGTVTNTSAEKQSTGGLIGAANLSVTMRNCLNTGSVSAPNYTKTDEGTTSIKPLIGGLIGYASPTQNITVLHSFNTGKVSFNSKATAGFGSIIGRIGNLGAEDTLGTIVVNNTYATNQSCWETISTSHKDLALDVEVVDDNVIGGENAREIMSGLFDETLTSNWTIGAENPILKDFAEYAAGEKSISNLHRWVTARDTLDVTLQDPITLPNPDGYINKEIRRQGGYTDGKYFYQAYIVYTAQEDKDNLVRVVKYDLESGKAVWSEELTLGHANDVTFNSKLGYLVVCHGDRKLSYFSISDDSLDYVETVELSSSVSRIDYNEERDVYVTGTSTTLYVLNSDLSRCSSVYNLPAAPEGGARQGVSCDNDYIYYAITDGHTSGDKVEKIEVYNWNGKLITTVTVTVNSDSDVIEFENISVVGDKLYIMAAEYSEFWTIQTEKPANVYIIDLSTTK